MKTPDPSNSVGRTIRFLRKRAGLTQEELADRTYLSRTSIANIENGKQTLTAQSISAIADALGYEVRIRFVRKER